MMIDQSILTILRDNPEAAKNLRLEINAFDLMAFLTMVERKITSDNERLMPQKDEMMTSKQVASEFQVSLVTLWNYDKRGITHPVKIGSQKRYRRSDIEAIFNKDKEPIN